METKQLRFFGLFIAFVFLPFLSIGQVNMTATGSYSQNFNTLATSGTNNGFSNNSTIPSWYVQREDSNANPNIYAADNGGSTAGRFYSYGTGTNSDRALGILNSNSTEDAAIGLLLRNTSGVTITSISVTYTLEQWRKGANGTQGITFRYRTSSSSFSDLNENSDTGWTSVSALDANGPISGGSSGSRDGNSASNRVTRTAISIPGLSLANGDYIMLRWRDINHTSDDHGFGIDDVTINYEVPSFIFLNDITTNNNSANPFTTNQVVNVNATASGIGRGPGLSYESEDGAYGANGWTTDNSIDGDDYFYWTITPNVGYQLNFESFDYQEERRDNDAPEDFSFRSSLNYNSSILTYNLTNEDPNNRSIGLGASQYQNVQSAITFRLYGWDAPGGPPQDREYRINNFAFFGTVTMIPPSVSNTAPTAICDNGSGSVTISGNNLIHVTSVTVGGTPVSIDSQTNTQLVVTVPQGVSGLVTVTNDTGSANGATITLLNAITYYADVDGDGFGDASSFVSNCTGQPVGYVTNNLDCDDNLLLYEDLDGDGFGSSVLVACGGSTNNSDTDDNLLTYVDADGDTYGSSTLAPSGVTNNTDCNDNDASIHPGAAEICYDGIDQNCNDDLNDGCPVILAELRTDNCGVQLTTINQALRGDKLSSPVPNSVSLNGYRFRITNLTTNEVRIVDRPNYIFQISSTDIAQYDTAYAIEVAVRLNNQWMPFGTICNVVTPEVPSTVIAATSCGETLVQMNNIIRAIMVPAAVNYEYEVSLIEGGFPVETTSIIRPGASFNLLQLTGISIKYASEYSIRVKVEVPTAIGLQWSSNYGAPCSVFTPLAPEAQIEGCGSELGLFPPSLNTVIYSTPVGGATEYRFTLSDENGYFQQYTNSARVCRLQNFNQLAPLTPGGNYTITTEAFVYGFYYAGKDCNITVPGGVLIRPASDITKEESILSGAIDFKVVAHPNPFSGHFALNLQTAVNEPVQVTIYDMTGRILEAVSVQSDVLSSQLIGESYPSGIYNVIVSQGEETRVIRVVKK